MEEEVLKMNEYWDDEYHDLSYEVKRFCESNNFKKHKKIIRYLFTKYGDSIQRLYSNHKLKDIDFYKIDINLSVEEMESIVYCVEETSKISCIGMVYDAEEIYQLLYTRDTEKLNYYMALSSFIYNVMYNLLPISIIDEHNRYLTTRELKDIAKKKFNISELKDFNDKIGKRYLIKDLYKYLPDIFNKHDNVKNIIDEIDKISK